MAREQIPGQRQIPQLATKKKPPKRPHRKSGFLKVLAYIGIALLLLIPSYIAVSHYIYQLNNTAPEVESYHTSVELVGPSGFLITAESGEKKDGHDLLDYFEEMIANALPVPQIPATHSTAYQVTLHDNKGVSEVYSFAFASDSSVAYFTDAQGRTFNVKEQYALPFLNSPHAYKIYPQATPPRLTSEGTDEIIPIQLSWSYRTQNDFTELLYCETTANEALEYPIVNDISFEFSLLPSTCTVIIQSESGEALYSGPFDGISLPPLEQDQLFTFEIRASYSPKSNVDYSGEVVYKFRMRVVEAADFRADTEAPVAGGFVVISYHNVRNQEKVVFSSVPALTSDPIVINEAGRTYALIPTPATGAQTLTITYGTVKTEIHLNVQPVTGNTCTLPAAALRGDWEGALSGELAALIAQHGATAQGSGLSATTYTPFAGTPTLSFGDTLTVEDGFSLTAPLALYEHSGTVRPVAAGKVAYVGECELLGRFVILDHGRGICTWYAGLSYVSATVGDTLTPDDGFALAGRGGIGLADKDSVVLLATLGKTAISPDFLCQYTLSPVEVNDER